MISLILGSSVPGWHCQWRWLLFFMSEYSDIFLRRIRLLSLFHFLLLLFFSSVALKHYMRCLFIFNAVHSFISQILNLSQHTLYLNHSTEQRKKSSKKEVMDHAESQNDNITQRLKAYSIWRLSVMEDCEDPQAAIVGLEHDLLSITQTSREVRLHTVHKRQNPRTSFTWRWAEWKNRAPDTERGHSHTGTERHSEVESPVWHRSRSKLLGKRCQGPKAEQTSALFTQDSCLDDGAYSHEWKWSFQHTKVF